MYPNKYLSINTLLISAKDSNNSWVNKQIIVYSYTDKQLSNKKEGTAEVCNNLYKPQTHYAEQKKPHPKVFILYGFLHEVLKKAKVADSYRRQMSGFLGTQLLVDYLSTGIRELSGWRKCSIFWLYWWLHQRTNLWKRIQLYL